MSDTQRDREERQHVIEVLKSWDGYFIGYTSDEVQEALRYAIASIETDLRYDLLYEETSGQADKQAPKMTNGQIYIGSMSHETAIGILKLMLEAMEVYDSISPTLERVNAVKMGIEALEQESNCLKIPTGSTTKDYLGVDYLGVDCISRAEVLKLMQDNWHTHNGDWAMQESMDDIRALPPATPQEPILDKIREQMKDYLRGVEITLEVLVENDPLRPKMEGAKDTLEECLEIIDKAESEEI